MKTQRWIKAGLCLLALHAANTYAADAANSAGERRQAAIQAGRAGKFDEALTALSALNQALPNDIGVASDYMVVLTWAKKPQDALKLAENIAPEQIPNYALNDLARAARDTRQYDTALKYYEVLMKRDAKNLDPQLGKALTLVDAAKFAEAEAMLSKLRQTYPDNTAVYRALTYLGRQAKQPVVVVDASTRLLELNAQDTEAARHLIIAAREVGAVEKAQALAQQYPQALDGELGSAEQLRGLNDGAAQRIAWGHFNGKAAKDRFNEVDLALAKLDAACGCDWAKLDLTKTSNQNLVFDRMVALRDRYRMPEVLVHYEQLVAAKLSVPAYALEAAGDAYLYQRMPEQALSNYDAALAKAPDNLSTKFARFYALVELERLDEAKQYANQVSKSIATYRNRPKNPTVRSNDAKLEADSKALYATAYGDDLAQAQAGFEALSRIGPMSSEVKTALAEISRWRGWPLRAEQQFKALIHDDETQLSTQVGLANTHLDLRDWKQAGLETKKLANSFPENTGVKELDRRWQLRNKRELVIDTDGGESNGAAIGNSWYNAQARLYSAPIDDNYRVFAEAQYQRGTFPEGADHAVYPGVGVEYSDRDLRLTGAINTANQSRSNPGAAFTAEYRLDDYWSFAGEAAVHSTEMPLRGFKDNISADLLKASATYRWSDLSAVSVGGMYMHMDDGNQRHAAYANLNQRLITLPTYKLTARLRVDASRNTESGVNYFNPERDFEYGAVMDNEWMQWRRYDSSFTHRLQLGLGNYWQKNFGSDATWLVSYAQRVKWDKQFEAEYGVLRLRHAYDGINEYRNQLFAHLNFIF